MDKRRKPGELGFYMILLIICVFFMVESIQLYIEAASISSYGTLPLLLSVFMVVLLLKILYDTWRLPKEEGEKTMRQKAAAGISHVFTKETAFFSILIAAYCVALYLGLGFIPCTAVFLFASMQFFMPKETLMNIVYTVVIVAAVYIIFDMIFKISLP